MKRFLPREKIRNCLLRGVYEQNLAILGTKTAFRRRRRFLAIRPAFLSVVFLSTILFGQAIPLNPLPWGPAISLGDLAAWPAQAWRARSATPDARSSAVGLEPGPAEFSVGAAASLDGSAYQRLAKDEGLKIRTVFGLEVKTIMIDAGHGGPAYGAVGKGGTAEKTITLDIARKLKAALERDTDYRILMTRDDDRDVPLKSRVALANEHKADLFISIHLNALPSKPIDIVETYFFGLTRDRETLELAAEVNEGSDYSYSEYNEVIKKIANQFKYEESRRLAESIQRTLYRSLKRRKPDVLDYGVKRGPFVVLLGVEMPAVLVEVACLSNIEEEDRLRDAAYRETIAAYLEAGITGYLGAHKKRSGVS